MDFEKTNRPHITAENIRTMLANGGYRRETTNGFKEMPRHEALLFAIEDAAKHNHMDLIKELIAEGGDVSAVMGPLIGASEAGHRHIVEFLIASGANVNGRNRFGETPLMVAASYGHADVVRYLLDQGADPTICDGGIDALGYAKMGFAEYNRLGSIPNDVRARFNKVIAILAKLDGSQKEI